MLNLKTHYEQVPLEIVRKIIAEQILTETVVEPYPGIDKEMLNEGLSEVEGQSVTQPSH
jgi:hypothetical protein